MPFGGAASASVYSGMPVGSASLWSVNDMETFLDSIALGHLKSIIFNNGLDGAFFLDFGHLKSIILNNCLDGAFFLGCSQEELEGSGIGMLEWWHYKPDLEHGGITPLQLKKIRSHLPQ